MTIDSVDRNGRSAPPPRPPEQVKRPEPEKQPEEPDRTEQRRAAEAAAEQRKLNKVA